MTIWSFDLRKGGGTIALTLLMVFHFALGAKKSKQPTHRTNWTILLEAVINGQAYDKLGHPS